MRDLESALQSEEVRHLYAAAGVEFPQVEMSQDMFALSSHEWMAEIGTPGTRIIDGRIEVEQNYRIKPYFARGRISSPGILEDVYRSEPVVFNSLNSISSLAIGALYEPRLEDTDEVTRAIALRAHRSIVAQKGGVQKFKRNAATAFRLGFAVHEPVWRRLDDGFVILDKLGFREQSTVDRWLFDQRGSELVGASFQTTAMPGMQMYVLPKGDTPESMRMVLTNIHATGNNVEGVSPVRVAVGLRKLKELLLSIQGVSYQKYGVPIAQVMRKLTDVSAASLVGTQGSDADVQMVVNRIQGLQAQIAPVLPMDPGVEVSYATPTNQMPDIRPMLEYLDALMALVFSNEGALLGSQSFGSYAMASVADNRFMRSAPVYAEAIAETMTELLHWMIRWNHPDVDSIEVWPEYGYRFAGTQDATRWAADMQVLTSAQVWTWPQEARRMAAANMGLSSTAFDEWTGASPDVSGQQVLTPEVV
jgi:hypothetical protein